VKVQEEKFNSMNHLEKDILKSLERILGPSKTTHAENETLSFAEQALKRRRTSKQNSKHIDTRFILPSTNIVERFFQNLVMH